MCSGTPALQIPRARVCWFCQSRLTPIPFPRVLLPSGFTMEGGASNKDLARARFKQQQHGRRVHGRGGGRRGTFGRKGEPGNSGSKRTTTRKMLQLTGVPWIFPPAYDDSDAEDPLAGPRLRSNGADLAALLAECDASALPRQHVSAYMDPSWSVDDLGELQRALGGRGSGLGGDELGAWTRTG